MNELTYKRGLIYYPWGLHLVDCYKYYIPEYNEFATHLKKKLFENERIILNYD